MSQIQRVIILNKPFRIRGYTMMQWVIMGVAFSIAVIVGTKCVPHDWKLGGVPTGVWIFVLLFGLGIGYVHVVQVKPIVWWRNRLFYAVGLEPQLYLPKREEGQEYPDASIKQPAKREDQSYVEVEHFDDAAL